MIHFISNTAATPITNVCSPNPNLVIFRTYRLNGVSNRSPCKVLLSSLFLSLRTLFVTGIDGVDTSDHVLDTVGIVNDGALRSARGDFER